MSFSIQNVNSLVENVVKELDYYGINLQSEVIQSAMDNKIRIYLTKTIELDRYELDQKTLFEQLAGATSEPVIKSRFADSLRNEIDALNKKVKDLERYKTYYDMQMQLNRGGE